MTDPERRAEQKRRYDQTENGRARHQRYNRSEKGKARDLRHKRLKGPANSQRYRARRLAEGKCVRCGQGQLLSQTLCWTCLSIKQDRATGL